MKLLKQALVTGLLTLGMGSAFAMEPISLTDTEMDNVTAGYASATGWANASGSLFAHASTRQIVINNPRLSIAVSISIAIAAGNNSNAGAGSSAIAYH